jgi:ABC-2 type transport system ATP-binding protein
VFEAERYADRVLVLADGELLLDGTPADLERAVDADPRVDTDPGVRRQPNSQASRRRPDFEAAFVAFLHARGH